MSSESSSEIKSWVKLSHSANGQTSIAVTLQDTATGVTSKWAEKCFVDPRTWGPALDTATDKAAAFLAFMKERDHG